MVVAGWHDLCTSQGSCALAAAQQQASWVGSSIPIHSHPSIHSIGLACCCKLTLVSLVSRNAATSTSTLGKTLTAVFPPSRATPSGQLTTTPASVQASGHVLLVAIPASSRTAERAGGFRFPCAHNPGGANDAQASPLTAPARSCLERARPQYPKRAIG